MLKKQLENFFLFIKKIVGSNVDNYYDPLLIESKENIETAGISSKCFLEFNIEVVLHTEYEDKDAAIKEIHSLISNSLNREDTVHMSANVSIISEDNMIFPLVGQTMDMEN